MNKTLDKKGFDIFVDIETKDHESPERALFLSVILQALLDATQEVKNPHGHIYRERARAWFFCSVGVTCDNFETVCDYAGMDVGYTRSFAYKVINSSELKYVRKKIKTILEKKE